MSFVLEKIINLDSNNYTMTYFSRILFIVIFLITCTPGYSQKKVDLLTVPAGDQPARIEISGTTILPSGRYVTPAGDLLRITDDPFGMAISPDGEKAVTLHDGVFTIIDLNSLSTIRVPSYDGRIKSPLSSGSYLGVAFSGDSKTVYLSGGDNGAVIIYDISTFMRLDSISLNGKVNDIEYNDSFTSDLVYNETENELIVLDRGNFRMVRIDLATNKITASVKVGRQPFGLSLSPDGKTAFVAKVGM
jgi:DNA-binding beta-propeller fold protein YncE